MRRLALGLGPTRGGGEPPAFTVSIGSGDVTTGTLLTAAITPDPSPLTPTYQWTDDGVNIAGRTSATYTPAIGTDSVADLSQIRCVVTIDSESYQSNARRIVYAAGAFGALSNQTFTEGVGGTYVFNAATGANLTWTYTLVSPPVGVTIDSATRTVTFADTLALQTGTSFTVRATDQAGRSIDQSATFTIEAATVGDAVLLESGDDILLETGDRLLLEAA